MAEHELLSQETTRELIARFQAGDNEAAETLVQANTALVRSIVKRFLNRSIEYEDLFQIGCMGLVKAISRFDLSYDVRFSTYAVPMIAGEIKRFLRDDGMIKVSRSLKELLSTLSPRERTIITLRYFSDKTQSQVAAVLGISQVQVSRLENTILLRLRKLL